MTAHITFAGGGLLLPARTPYDLQLLREHVLDRARHVKGLQVTVARKTWLVERPDNQQPFVCGLCKRDLTVAALHAPAQAEVYCVACALC
ncbi:MAG TPA: hypothetical protein VMW56_15465 [Candidatus Margulisiibacteriota bacterium]|nr:hypothetical protein [Candidatus Margulisiibacteriota bacterium]